MLSISEKIILSSIDENKNKFTMRSYNFYNYGIKGAAVLQLAARGRIQLDDNKIVIVDTSPTGDDITDEVLQQLNSIGKPIRLNSWFYSYVRQNRNLKLHVLNNLEDKGIILKDERRFLGLIPYVRYNVTNISEKMAVKKSLREALFSGNTNIDGESVILLSLAAVCGGVGLFFDREEYRQMKDKIRLIRKGEYFEGFNNDLKQVLKGIQSAIASHAAAAAAAGA